MILRIRGDNIGALTLLVKLRPPTSNPAMGVIARELALHLAQLSFQPEATQHPGPSPRGGGRPLEGTLTDRYWHGQL